MKNFFFIFWIGCSFCMSAQVNMGSLSLANKSLQGIFYNTTYCESDIVLTTAVDTGSAGGFQYSWSFYTTDSNQTVGQTLLSKPFTSGAVDFTSINAALDSVKKLNEAPIMFRLIGKNNSSSDTATIPLIIRNISTIDTTYLSIDGNRVFIQPNKLPFSQTFPGPWVGPYVLIPNIFFHHGYYDYILFRMTEFDSTGTALRNVPFEVPFNDTLAKVTGHSDFSGFAIAGRTLDPNDRFVYNTDREYYRFTYYYGIYGCGHDSVSTYFRVINPDELSLGKLSTRNIQFSPNPIQNKLHYSNLPEVNGQYTLELVDMNGKRVLEKTLNETEGNIPLQLSSGFYLYHLKDENGKVVQVGKLIAE